MHVCKSNKGKATRSPSPVPWTTTLSCGNKNLRDFIVAMFPGYDAKKRYKITAEYDAENRAMYSDMTTAEEPNFRISIAKTE